jgi:superoxide dismutase, Fe-Mn family
MKFVFRILLLITIILQSCNNKKYTEVVEVPLPSTAEKITIGKPDEVKEEKGGAFKVIELPYKYEDLQPTIDAFALETHYAKHYLSYTNNLNKAVVGTKFEEMDIDEILSKMDLTNESLRNNAGGYYNHNLFFETIGAKKIEQPKDTLLGTIKRDFGSYENFITMFKESANKQFGSGWTWLVVNKAGQLQICNTQNQDNPLMPRQVVKGIPILALDLWEHAYYLDYQDKRRKYIDSYFNSINWKTVGKKYEKTL